MKGYRYIGCKRSAVPCGFCGGSTGYLHTICYAPLTRMMDGGWTIPMSAATPIVCRACADRHICAQQKSVPELAERMLSKDSYGIGGNWLSIWVLNELVFA